MVVCGDGQEALEYLQDHQPDLIILDVMMPAMSGLDVLKRPRTHPVLAHIPVVLMSSFTVLADKAAYGWNEIVRKPFTLERITRIVHRYLSN